MVKNHLNLFLFLTLVLSTFLLLPTVNAESPKNAQLHSCLSDISEGTECYPVLESCTKAIDQKSDDLQSAATACILKCDCITTPAGKVSSYDNDVVDVECLNKCNNDCYRLVWDWNSFVGLDHYATRDEGVKARDANDEENALARDKIREEFIKKCIVETHSENRNWTACDDRFVYANKECVFNDDCSEHHYTFPQSQKVYDTTLDCLNKKDPGRNSSGGIDDNFWLELQKLCQLPGYAGPDAISLYEGADAINLPDNLKDGLKECTGICAYNCGKYLETPESPKFLPCFNECNKDCGTNSQYGWVEYGQAIDDADTDHYYCPNLKSSFDINKPKVQSKWRGISKGIRILIVVGLAAIAYGVYSLVTSRKKPATPKKKQI
ncbi:MAG: hypothetical protein QT02_C0007G0024 [archaeon GW2011_AR9]|nr:MAG: hypothetical protein QT02_C0007G0024 [archaeon GW2011_AR9]MBS3120789.1 hypothetical protein [Candidatus Woesearchaeota archaeon]